jgi:hypothetical protein
MTQKIKINPSNLKVDRWNLNFEDIPLPENFKLEERWIVYLGSGKIGGNHKHERREVLIGIGEGLKFVYINEEGDKVEELMNPQGELFMIVTEPWMSHAVINKGKEGAVLIEFTDKKGDAPVDVEVI